MPAADSADTAASRPGFISRLRGLLADALELAHVRLELLALEAREESARLLAVLLCALAAAAFLCLGLAFLAVFLTVLLWDEHRLLALGVFTALFLGGGAGSDLLRARPRDGEVVTLDQHVRAHAVASVGGCQDSAIVPVADQLTTTARQQRRESGQEPLLREVGNRGRPAAPGAGVLSG